MANAPQNKFLETVIERAKDIGKNFLVTFFFRFKIKW